MSTVARIAFITRENGYRLEFSKTSDGCPYAVLGNLRPGKFTIQDLITQWKLTEKMYACTDYFYDFDLRNMTMKIWEADMSEIPWKQGELIFDGTVEEAYKKYYLDAPKPQMPNQAIVMTHLANPTFSEFDKQKITVRSQDVLLDTQVANIYGVSVTEVRRVTSQNKERFSTGFAFRLSRDEIKSLPEDLRAGLNLEKNRYLPYVFTEQGFSMLSMHLHSEIAINANLDMVRAITATNTIQELMQKILHKL